MSASLVGSEMCIRDSASSALGAGGRSPVGPTSCSFGGWNASPTPWSGPVSYTHLTLPTICSV
eukprot:12254982-Alexandrium_andersonii.AAC.1